ncbi:uncharacterized protein [Oryza sativa Japonica Group]|uniref:Os02g0163500 protein n=6 Tax=Oryza TaxID=4527 RepID=B9F367_ORYSJ|nr:uncharacterized protein LOC4328399 [Oryza sativa Japonica Group]XP_015623872.1 uncharacterized protein LOC4328399 [Oryza sativa Japonica Group]KAB8085996.1 hypothetical protein EE612_009038 [Oryza sativa]EEE56364.1 hypothetical protein OsJ_05495 [Oryza sativa Japonica Group]KAF2943230.1 hypothetical protein DAI22_02g050500 [Oryza sativa Japonica Group]KAF2943231.1 hypothetical protein DAI22_02g050500 [Oryza sativa Japonica Group]BAF07900.1 Os02g0163500 [Oryza sativa Japonica Group]|eukprot:NP_001045986.1 Os02g0163500 [Oryza sativa Japonica Group]
MASLFRRSSITHHATSAVASAAGAHRAFSPAMGGGIRPDLTNTEIDKLLLQKSAFNKAGIFSARGKITHANVEKGLVLSECLKILRREGEQQSWAKLWCKQIAAVVIFGVLFRSGEPEKHEPNASS